MIFERHFEEEKKLLQSPEMASSEEAAEEEKKDSIDAEPFKFLDQPQPSEPSKKQDLRVFEQLDIDDIGIT